MIRSFLLLLHPRANLLQWHIHNHHTCRVAHKFCLLHQPKPPLPCLSMRRIRKEDTAPELAYRAILIGIDQQGHHLGLIWKQSAPWDVMLQSAGFFMFSLSQKTHQYFQKEPQTIQRSGWVRSLIFFVWSEDHHTNTWPMLPCC